MYLVIDFETTGFDANENEIVEVACIDDSGNIIINERCCPRLKKEWQDAQKIHGISPLDVAGKKPFEDYVKILQDAMLQAEYVVAYNAPYERSYLKKYGFPVERIIFVDPMPMFAKIYGEWNDYYQNYKWQKLTTCARYFGYDLANAHAALEDVKATLYCYKRIQSIRQNKINLEGGVA